MNWALKSVFFSSTYQVISWIISIRLLICSNLRFISFSTIIIRKKLKKINWNYLRQHRWNSRTNQVIYMGNFHLFRVLVHRFSTVLRWSGTHYSTSNEPVSFFFKNICGNREKYLYLLSRPAPGRNFTCCSGIPAFARSRGHGCIKDL